MAEIIAQIKNISDVQKLNEIAEAAKRQLEVASRSTYRPGTLVMVDFNTRGTLPAVIKSIGQKNFSIVLIGPQETLPRHSRHWRVSPTMLTAVPPAQLAELEAQAKKLRQEQPYLFA